MNGVASVISDETNEPRRVIMQRRSVRRVHVDYPAALQTTGNLADARIADISKRGARLQINNPIASGTHGWLKIDGQEVACSVIWYRDGHCGIEFAYDLKAETLAIVLENAVEEYAPVACAQLIPFGQKRGGRLVLDQ